jgi:hypothetical protein
MNLDRWRGQLGFLGWCVRKWDVWQIKRIARKGRQERRIYGK